MNEKDLNLRRREREAKVPVALWAASGPSRPEDERRQRGRRRRQPASGAKQAVKSFPRNQTKKTAPKGCCFFRLNMNEKDLNLRRREREAKVPVALWAASGPSRPEDERRQRGRRRRQPASGVKQAVKSFPLRPQQ